MNFIKERFLLKILIPSIFFHVVLGYSLFPSDLISKVRFYHLQESYYNPATEKALWQAEIYLAQDLVESIEDASFIVGMSTNPLFLPLDRMTIFAISQRMRLKYQSASLCHLHHILMQKAYDVYKRQHQLETSAIFLNELEKEWLEWWNLVFQSSYALCHQR